MSPHTDAGALLKLAEEAFEFIRLKLVDDLDEPQRSAFWKAVEMREKLRQAASQGSAGGERSEVLTDEMVNAGARVYHPLAFEIDDDGTYLVEHVARMEARKETRAILTAALSVNPAQASWRPDLQAARDAVRDEIGSRLCHLTPHGTRICTRQVSSTCLCEETARAALCSQAPTPSVPSASRGTEA